MCAPPDDAEKRTGDEEPAAEAMTEAETAPDALEGAAGRWRDGGEPVSDPLGPKHLIATILQSLFHHGQLRLAPALGQVSRLADHPPIPDLL